MITIYDERDATIYKLIFHSGIKKGWGGTVGIWYGQNRDIAKWEDIIPDVSKTLKSGEAEVRSVDSSSDRQILIRILFEYSK